MNDTSNFLAGVQRPPETSCSFYLQSLYETNQRNDSGARNSTKNEIGTIQNDGLHPSFPLGAEYLDINRIRYVQRRRSQSWVSTSRPFTIRSMLFRSEAGGVVTVEVEVGSSGGGSAEAARVGGDPTLGLAGEELRLLARGATCSNAEPSPGNAYGANRCVLLREGAGPDSVGGGGSEL